MTDDALQSFKKVKGWEVGVDGNVALIDVGGGKRLDTTTLKGTQSWVSSLMRRD